MPDEKEKYFKLGLKSFESIYNIQNALFFKAFITLKLAL